MPLSDYAYANDKRTDDQVPGHVSGSVPGPGSQLSPLVSSSNALMNSDQLASVQQQQQQQQHPNTYSNQNNNTAAGVPFSNLPQNTYKVTKASGPNANTGVGNNPNAVFNAAVTGLPVLPAIPGFTNHGALMTPLAPTVSGGGGAAVNHSGNTSSGHNDSEKKYRNNINTHFQFLRNSVPTLRWCDDNSIPVESLEGLAPPSKVNKVQILSKSHEYIKHLERKNSLLQQENEQLRMQLAQFMPGHHNSPGSPNMNHNSIMVPKQHQQPQQQSQQKQQQQRQQQQRQQQQQQPQQSNIQPQYQGNLQGSQSHSVTPPSSTKPSISSGPFYRQPGQVQGAHPSQGQGLIQSHGQGPSQQHSMYAIPPAPMHNHPSQQNYQFMKYQSYYQQPPHQNLDE